MQHNYVTYCVNALLGNYITMNNIMHCWPTIWLYYTIMRCQAAYSDNNTNALLSNNFDKLFNYIMINFTNSLLTTNATLI